MHWLFNVLILLLTISATSRAASVVEIQGLFWEPPPPATCTSSDIRKAGPPATADIDVFCYSDETGEATLTVSAYASPFEVRAFGNSSSPPDGWNFGVVVTAMSTTKVWISGGTGPGLVTFVLAGGTSTGAINFSALGGSEGDEIFPNPLGPLPFIFGKQFDISLYASSVISPSGLTFADADIRLEGIIVTDLLGNEISDAQLQVVPEPRSLIMLGSALGLLWLTRGRFSSKCA